MGQLPFGNRVIQVTAVPERGTDGLFVDADAIPEKAVFRSPQPGDRFCRYGGLTKKLGDYLTDRKIPLRERLALPVLAVGAQVLCVLPLEIAEEVKITPKTTRILRLKLCTADKGPQTETTSGGMNP